MNEQNEFLEKVGFSKEHSSYIYKDNVSVQNDWITGYWSSVFNQKRVDKTLIEKYSKSYSLGNQKKAGKEKS